MTDPTPEERAFHHKLCGILYETGLREVMQTAGPQKDLLTICRFAVQEIHAAIEADRRERPRDHEAEDILGEEITALRQDAQRDEERIAQLEADRRERQSQAEQTLHQLYNMQQGEELVCFVVPNHDPNLPWLIKPVCHLDTTEAHVLQLEAQLHRLTDERAECGEHCGSLCPYCEITRLQAQLRETEQQVLASHQANRELEQKLRERAEDTERLDWLSARVHRSPASYGYKDERYCLALDSGVKHDGSGVGLSLREAIDAARAQESGE